MRGCMDARLDGWKVVLMEWMEWMEWINVLLYHDHALCTFFSSSFLYLLAFAFNVCSRI